MLFGMSTVPETVYEPPGFSCRFLSSLKRAIVGAVSVSLTKYCAMTTALNVSFLRPFIDATPSNTARIATQMSRIPTVAFTRLKLILIARIYHDRCDFMDRAHLGSRASLGGAAIPRRRPARPVW